MARCRIVVSRNTLENGYDWTVDVRISHERGNIDDLESRPHPHLSGAHVQGSTASPTSSTCSLPFCRVQTTTHIHTTTSNSTTTKNFHDQYHPLLPCEMYIHLSENFVVMLDLLVRT